MNANVAPDGDLVGFDVPRAVMKSLSVARGEAFSYGNLRSDGSVTEVVSFNRLDTRPNLPAHLPVNTLRQEFYAALGRTVA